MLKANAGNIVFQFTLPCRERPSFKRGRETIFGFNSRSRVGSDECWNLAANIGNVSIHAPV